MKKFSLLLCLALLILASKAAEPGQTCVSDDDCPALNSCKGKPLVCTHKDLFPITVREVFSTFFNLLLNAFFTAGGVGGGAAYVPYIVFMFNYTLTHAIQVAYLCTFGGGLGNFLNVITLKNPKTGRYLTNYTINMIVLPTLMVGVQVGLLLQRMFPPLVTNLILLLTLAYAAIKNYFKLKFNLAKERKEREDAKKQALKTEEKEMNSPNNDSPNGSPTDRNLHLALENKDYAPVNQDDSPIAKKKNFEIGLSEVELVARTSNDILKPSEVPREDESAKDPLAEKRRLIEAKERRYPFHKVREILLIIPIIVVIGLIRGSKTFKPIVGVTWTCGWDFIWFAVFLVLYTLVLLRAIYLILKWQKEKLEVGYEFLPEEPLLTRKRLIRLIIVSFCAGILGALLALGGSLIVGPTVLDFGVPPQFSAATTCVFMLFSMFNTTYSTVLNAKVTGLELAWFIPTGFCVSFLASRFINWYIRKTGRQSTIIMCIMFASAVGAVCITVIMIRGLIVDTKTQITFLPIC